MPTPDETSCPETDPDDDPAIRLDAEIAAAAKSLFFASDLLRPGPGMLPFGAKARDRRERRHQVDAIAATRRAELGELLAQRRNTRVDRSVRTARRGHPRLVATVLASLVVAVAVAGWWMSLTITTAAPPPELAETGSAATHLPLYEPDPATTVGSAGAAAAQSDPGVDRSTPEAAAVSWLAAWCPTDPHRNPDAVTADIRDLMTTDGWAQFTATPGQLIADAPSGTTASCDTPIARVLSRPPGSDRTVIVEVSATRTLAGPDSASAANSFRVERRQYVIRGDDGVWRVDVAAVGG